MTRIEDIDDSRIDIFTKFNEAQLYHYYEPNGGIFIAETPEVIKRALNRGAEPIAFFIEEKAYNTDTIQRTLCSLSNDVDIFTAKLEIINQITGFNLTRGVLTAFKRPSLPKIPELLSNSKRIAILEDIMNPTNVGAIFRSAAALGVDCICLTSNCADPFYRRASRVSMGTVFQVPWSYFPKASDYISILKDSGFSVISMALRDNAISLSSPILKEQEKLAIIFGTESSGIKEETIDKSDFVVIIPMHNGVDSLNVAAASSVTFWELCKS